MDNQLTPPKPIIFPFEDNSQFKKITENKPWVKIIDTYSEQMNELFESRNPKFKGDLIKQQAFLSKLYQRSDYLNTGNWVYFPWKESLVHLLDENYFQEIRTNRNYPLISKRDQKKFMNLKIGVVGLSVGNAIVQTIAYSGGGNIMKLADPDTLQLSNLNRIKASITDLGEPKTFLAAKQVYEINPYAQLTLYPEGITPNTLEDFLIGEPKLDIIIDEADDITVKHYLRLAARSLKLPLSMTTDNGFESNTQMLRFDKSPNAGGMKTLPDLNLSELIESYKDHEPIEMTEHQKLKLIASLVGVNQISKEMQQGSILKAKGKIAGYPQVAMTVFAGGSLAAYAAKLVAAGAKTYKRQTSFSISSHLRPSNNSSHFIKSHKNHTKKFIKFLQNI